MGVSDGWGDKAVRGLPVSGKGAEQAHLYAKSQLWESNDVVMIMPTRGTVRIEVWRAHDRLSFPMNLKKAKLDAVGMEVGAAYDYLVDMVLSNPHFANWPWILTYEEDNVPEQDALMKLFEAIRHCPDCKERIGNKQFCSQGHRGYDGVQALYWTKSDPPMPMAYGDPNKEGDTFDVQNVIPYIEAENPLDQIIPVTMCTQGFTLFRKSLFEKMSRPWFKTVDPIKTEHGAKVIGQDCYMAIKARHELGARFGVHCGVKCGHIDTATGEVF